jgi:hypothetical protein
MDWVGEVDGWWGGKFGDRVQRIYLVVVTRLNFSAPGHEAAIRNHSVRSYRSVANSDDASCLPTSLTREPVLQQLDIEIERYVYRKDGRELAN